MPGQQDLFERRVAFGPAPVDFVCRKESHLAAASRGGRGGLTIFQRRWAYCDGETTDTEHQWEPTGGTPIRELIDWDRAVEPLRAHTIRGPR